MAVHSLGIHMQGQRNIAVGTSIHRPTLPTHDKARITTAIEHENHLLFFNQTVLDSL
ncbi:hypothetical protein CGSSp23BS72_02239 [Streptococcus pneumoniae SP23-BS72]|nr:hypothetical protein CGSSp11BS70_02754 [Streptococcus pneumoniae SP11-BS70]EDK66839.1 hypothetical protein CGSSp14BS69_10026 [Streptococcus pneumoniae SP14-BS69]EDK76228.1 hypothetical protein CGSSp6BS73_07869 [Streptococcus pneumoniae SP6-BS73]EDK81443.1 hypothetical protein CGSSp23BS72_02239 [Streptococcus pneumoniae SP23-BS72]CJG56173.1 Uncharacterised protein [Streptococcus pneumoniae]